MGIDDLVNKGKQAFEDNKDKIDDVVNSEKFEEISDNVLDGAAGAAKKVAPDSADGKIDEIRDGIDGKLGRE